MYLMSIIISTFSLGQHKPGVKNFTIVTTVVIATTFTATASIATAASVRTYSEFQQTLHHSGEIHVLSQETHISHEDKEKD